MFYKKRWHTICQSIRALNTGRHASLWLICVNARNTKNTSTRFVSISLNHAITQHFFLWLFILAAADKNVTGSRNWNATLHWGQRLRSGRVMENKGFYLRSWSSSRTEHKSGFSGYSITGPTQNTHEITGCQDITFRMQLLHLGANCSEILK